MTCRWDNDTGAYLAGDQPCTTDAYGDPTHHCQARKTCPLHIAPGELTCMRCLTRARADLRTISDLAMLLGVAAICEGVNSEAANLAGPAADPEAWSWRKVTAKQGGPWHLSLHEDDDDHHPYTVLTRWEWMIREDYHQPCDTPTSIWAAASYLERTLHRIAQDPGQDFPLLARELRRCRTHLEAVLHDSDRAEQGAPCPDCADAGQVVRLQHTYPHWCVDPDCTRLHYADASHDTWVCPRNPEHAWTERAYRDYLEERTA
jgi:hypothetical protein